MNAIEPSNPTDPRTSPGRQWRILRLSTDYLPTIFGRGLRACYEVVENGLPPDTRIINVQMAPGFSGVLLLLESEEFTPVPESHYAPEIEVVCRRFTLPWVKTN